MAGEKLSPRQRMIGMMYLVLTALLALQVTSSVLDKFIFLNRSLENARDEAAIANRNTIVRIKDAVDEAGNRKDDVAVLKKAEEVNAKTSQVIKYTEDLKNELLETTGGREGNGYKSASDEEATANIFINKKKGDEMMKELNNYAAQLSQITGEQFAPIAFDGKDHPIFKDDAEQKGKDFATLNFQNTPMAAGMATITQFQSEVMAYETRALDGLARKVGAKDLKFDNIVVMVKPQSNIVASGGKYRGEMFIAASSSAADPKMFQNGNPIPVEAGMGQVEFTVTGGNYDKDGLLKKTFKAEIKLPDTTFTQDVEYFVAKPVIQVQSASVSALYLNCGNELNVQVPALGTEYKPSFSATGAATIPGNKPGLVTVVPNAADVQLSVRSSGNLIGTEPFKVRRIPKPELKVFTRGNKEANVKTGEKISTLRSIDVKAIPDESFAQFLPKDARYRVTKWEITLARGSRPVGSTMRVTSATANVGQLMSRAINGDRLVIEVKEVQRMNFRGAVEEVNMGNFTMAIPLTD